MWRKNAWPVDDPLYEPILGVKEIKVFLWNLLCMDFSFYFSFFFFVFLVFLPSPPTVRACRIGLYVIYPTSWTYLYSLSLSLSVCDVLLFYFSTVSYILSFSLFWLFVCVWVNIQQTQNHKKKVKEEKKTKTLLHNGEPYGNRQLLSFSAIWGMTFTFDENLFVLEFWRKSPLTFKTQRDSDSNYYFSLLNGLTTTVV